MSTKFSLRAILVFPFILQIFVAVGLTGWLSFRNGQQAINEVAGKLRGEVTARVQEKITTYLEKPRLVNKLNVESMNQGYWSLQDFASQERHFLLQAKVFSPIYSGVGTSEGGFRASEKLNTATLLVRSDKPGDTFLTYEVNDQGNITRLLNSVPNYDPRSRPWYKLAKQAGKSTWNPIFTHAASKALLMVHSLPVYNKNRELLGVTFGSIKLSEMNEFLNSIKIGKSGKVFIVERSGLLIATSTPEKPFTISNDGKEQKRRKVTDSNDPLIQLTAQYLNSKFGDLRNIEQTSQLDFLIDGKRQFLQVTPLRDDEGLDWLMVVVVPEADFMEQIDANTRNTILLSIVALAIAIILGIFTSQWINFPISSLNRISRSIAAGDFTQKVPTSKVRELHGLASSFNQMSQQLQQSYIQLTEYSQSLEQRVEERTIELKVAKEVADSANQSKSEFLANMSHELRTPLNGILGYAQILGRSKVIPEKERNGVHIIHQCGSHLLTLINDILDISKIEARKLELAPRAIHLPSLLQGVVELSQIRAQQKNIDFHYQPDANLPSGIVADEKRWRQVLINLLGNAIKFTDKGSVTLKVERLDSNTNQHLFTHLRFSVKDTGVGISSKDVQKLFRAFEQVGERSRQAEGTGLGLAISQQIVQLMGGQIQVQSQLGVGSEFFFEVELALATDWTQQQTSAAGNVVSYTGRQRRILVVDDHWENRAVIVNLLEPLGFVTIEAENGQEGLNKMREQLPDLVITDLAMPVMDGFEMLKNLRNDRDLKHLKVVVSSASVAQLDQQMSLDAGGDDFLVKPINAQDLFNALANHLQLTWNYEETAAQTTSTIPVVAASSELIAPAPADLQVLLELAQEGRLKKLAVVAELIGQKDERYQSFIQRILQLVKQFQSEKIEQLIQEHLTTNNL